MTKLSPHEKSRLLRQYGEWAIVTGSSSGIGKELAIQLADAGFNLIIHGRDQQRLDVLFRQLSQNNILVKAVSADLSDKKGIDDIIQAAEGLNVGLLINNAGFGTSGRFVDSILDEEINMVRVNIEAVVALSYHFSNVFRNKKRGGLIFLSSLVAFQGVPYASCYAATKAFVQSFAEAIAEELKPFQVDVLAVAPGPVDSGFGPRANMRMGKAISPHRLSAPILKAIGRQTNVIPGMLSKLLVYSLRTAPRSLKIRIMEKIMGSFTSHQRDR